MLIQSGMLDEILGPRTSDTISTDKTAARGRIHAWDVVGSTYISNVILSNWAISKSGDLFSALFELSLQGSIFSHSNARSSIVNVFLDMGGNMILVAGNISMRARAVLPEIEVGDKEVLSLFSCSIKLNPLQY
jgi:hypothetical protein